MTLRFEWDEAKNKTNRQKHGIWFEEAISVFDDTHGRLFLDNSENEDRYVLIGIGRYSGTLVVVHCYREDESIIRIISARKATRKERAYYEERI